MHIGPLFETLSPADRASIIVHESAHLSVDTPATDRGTMSTIEHNPANPLDNAYNIQQFVIEINGSPVSDSVRDSIREFRAFP